MSFAYVYKAAFEILLRSGIYIKLNRTRRDGFSQPDVKGQALPLFCNNAWVIGFPNGPRLPAVSSNNMLSKATQLQQQRICQVKRLTSVSLS